MPETLDLPTMTSLVEMSSRILPGHLQSYYTDVMYYIIGHEEFKNNFRFLVPMTMGIILKHLPSVEPEIFAEELATFVGVWAITHSKRDDDRSIIEVDTNDPTMVPAVMLATIGEEFMKYNSHLFL